MDGGKDGISKRRMDNKQSFLPSCKIENPFGPLRNKLQKKSWGIGDLKIIRN